MKFITYIEHGLSIYEKLCLRHICISGHYKNSFFKYKFENLMQGLEEHKRF